MDSWFLILGLFLPRLALIIGFCGDSLPHFQYPSTWMNWVGGILVPRVLICWYVGLSMGCDSPWFIAHVILAILVYIGASQCCED